MKYIKVDKEYVLNDEQFFKRCDHLWFHWEGVSGEEQDAEHKKQDEGNLDFIKQVAPSVREYFDKYAKRVSPKSKYAATTYGDKHIFQKPVQLVPEYDGRPFYSTERAFVLIMLEAGLDVYKVIDGSYWRYISPYCFKKRRKSRYI